MPSITKCKGMKGRRFHSLMQQPVQGKAFQTLNVVHYTSPRKNKGNNLDLDLLKELLELLINHLMNLLGHLLSARDSLLRVTKDGLL